MLTVKLIHLGKAWIHLSSHHLWVDIVVLCGNQSEKTDFQTVKNPTPGNYSTIFSMTKRQFRDNKENRIMITYILKGDIIRKRKSSKRYFIISHTLKEEQCLLFIFDFSHQSFFNVFFLLLIQQLLLSKFGFTFYLLYIYIWYYCIMELGEA